MHPEGSRMAFWLYRQCLEAQSPSSGFVAESRAKLRRRSWERRSQYGARASAPDISTPATAGRPATPSLPSVGPPSGTHCQLSQASSGSQVQVRSLQPVSRLGIWPPPMAEGPTRSAGLPVRPEPVPILPIPAELHPQAPGSDTPTLFKFSKVPRILSLILPKH